MDNPLLAALRNPEQFGTFGEVVFDCYWHGRIPDPRELAELHRDIARNELKRDPKPSRALREFVANDPPLPKKRRGRPVKRLDTREILNRHKPLIDALRHGYPETYPTTSHAIGAIDRQLALPLDPAVVRELFDLALWLAPAPSAAEQARVWVGELFGVTPDRVKQILRQMSRE